jgi:uncharacterized protein with PIN domain
MVRYLRALGFDVFYDPSLSNRKIIEISQKENRIILTESPRLLKFADVTHGIFLRPGRLIERIKRIIDDLDIRDQADPFSRCLLCNSLLESISKDKFIDRIPPKVKEFCDHFTYCGPCDKIYWNGTHMHNMKKLLDSILDPPQVERHT